MEPSRYIRSRYVLALSVMGGLLIVIFALMEVQAHRQKSYGRVIQIAENQVALVGRIAFFSGELSRAQTRERQEVGKTQLREAIEKMRMNHDSLVHGNVAAGIPLINTATLERIYNDEATGLNHAVETFLAQAESVAGRDASALADDDEALSFVTSFGPFILATMLESAVVEYEAYVRAEIENLELTMAFALAAALLLLVVEAGLIFRPLEKKVHDQFVSLKENEISLRRARDKADMANKTKSAFLANMSHELRTPLNAIIGFSDGIRYGVYDKSSHEAIDTAVTHISSAGHDLLALVNDILDFSAAELDDLPLVDGDVCIHDLVLDAVEGLSPLVDAKSIRIRLHAAESPTRGLRVKADCRRTRQVIVNLISNAIKFSDPGGEVTLEIVRRDDGRAGFAVRDRGRGMTETEIAVARKPFGQVAGPHTRSQAGTGLGLPISIKIMERHGGALSIESASDRGTAVTALFPADRVVGFGAIARPGAGHAAPASDSYRSGFDFHGSVCPN